MSLRVGDRSDASGIPRTPPRYVERERLTAQLDSAHDCSLLVVRASGGSGKSGLIAAWLRRPTVVVSDTGARAVWVSLDEGSRSRSSFWRRLVRSFEHAGIISPESALAQFALGNADIDEVPGYFLEHLAHRGEPTLLVLDDFHLVDDSNAADIIWILKRTSHLRVIITTRRRGPFDTIELSTQLPTLVLTEQDLQFSLEETRTLFTSMTELDPHCADVVHEATHGHPLATRVAITLLMRQPGRFLTDIRQAPALVRQLTDHIAHTLLPAFSSPDELLFAAMLALPPETDVELAAELIERPAAAAQLLLARYANDGLGEFHPTARGVLFRFHPLIAHALQRHAEQVLTAAELSSLRTLSAEHLSSAGNGLGALKLLILAGKYSAVWPTVAQHFSALITHQQDELHALLAMIPFDVLRKHGTLTICLAIVMSERERTPSARLRQMVQMAITQLDSLPQPHDPREALFISLARFAGLRSARRYPEAAEQGARFATQIQSLSPEDFVSIAQAIGAGLIQIVITNVLLGRWTDATEIAHYLSPDDHPGRTQHRASLLAYIAAFRGDMNESRRQLETVTSAHAHGWLTSIPSTGWHLATSLSRIERGDYSGALEAIATLDARLSFLEHWPFALWTKALIFLARNETELAIHELDAGLLQHKFRPVAGYAQGLLSSMMSDLHLATGRREGATKELEQFPLSTELVAPRFSRVRLLLASGDIAEASNHLAATKIHDRGTFREWAEGVLLRAVIALRSGNEAEALERAREGLGIMQRHGLRTPLLMVPHHELQELIATQAPDLEHHFQGIADPFGSALLENPLTPREREVLSTLAGAVSIDEVAKELFVSVNTVKSQLRSVYRKLEVSSGIDAIRVAQQRGFISR